MADVAQNVILAPVQSFLGRVIWYSAMYFDQNSEFRVNFQDEKNPMWWMWPKNYHQRLFDRFV